MVKIWFGWKAWQRASPHSAHLTHHDTHTAPWPLRKEVPSTEPSFYLVIYSTKSTLPWLLCSQAHTQQLRAEWDFQGAPQRELGWFPPPWRLDTGLTARALAATTWRTEATHRGWRTVTEEKGPWWFQEVLDQHWIVYLQTYFTWEKPQTMYLCHCYFGFYVIWTDILLTNLEELRKKVKEIFKKMSLKKKKW